MSEFSPIVLFTLLLTLVIGVIAGCLLANRRNRKLRRQLQTDLNQQSLQLLAVKKDLSALETHRDQFARKDRLVKHTLKKLASATELTKQFDKQSLAKEREHFIQTSQLRVAAAEARQQAQRAAKAATTTSQQLKNLEALYTQTINAPKPKSYGQGKSVKVSVVDQHTPAESNETVARIPNRDLARLSRLHSSNECNRFGGDINAISLQALDGIGPALERILNAAGIHHIEQLANLSDRELIELPIPKTEAQTVAARATWKSGAKEWLDQRSNG